jgi:hypothetical protein
VTCTTQLSDGAASCLLTKDLNKKKASILFTVRGLSKASYTYVSANNHDEVDDDGSGGTTITVNRP